jgi:hypothetical protein
MLTAKSLQPLPEVCYPGQASWRSAPWWTQDQVRERLSEAAWVLRRLPLPKRGKPPQLQAAWPDVVHDWLGYGWSLARAPRLPPTAAEITRLDECLGWLHWLTRDQRLIIWARANRWTWRKIVELDELERDGHGRTERWLRQIAGDGEARILSRLNGTPGRMVLDASYKA